LAYPHWKLTFTGERQHQRRDYLASFSFYKASPRAKIMTKIMCVYGFECFKSQKSILICISFKMSFAERRIIDVNLQL